MNTIKSKGKSKTHISPGQLRNALIMTGREYRETPEYKEKAKQQLATILEQITPKIKQFQDFANQINQHIESSGLPQIMKRLREQYSSILEDSQPKELFISPRANNAPVFLPSEVIEEISQKSAEKISEIINKSGELKNSGKWLIFYTKDNVELKINKENGDVKLGKTEGNIAPGTQEYKVLLCLLESSSYIAEYKTLLKLMYPDKNFEGLLRAYQVDVWALNTVIRNIKRVFGILPRKNTTNKDIFRTLKKHKAYSLSLKN